MGLTITASAKSAEAPDIEAGIYDARFEGVEAKVIEKSQYDPNCFVWAFTLLDDDGKPLYADGEPVEVEKLTSQSTNTKSKTTPGAVKVLKAIMTPAEFSAFEREEPVDADALVGRKVQVVVAIKESGWPSVDEVLAARKARRPSRDVEFAQES